MSKSNKDKIKRKILISNLFLKEASRKNIKCKNISAGHLFLLELSYERHYEYLLGKRSTQLSYVSNYIAENKALTKYFLAKNKISHTKGRLFPRNDFENISRFLKETGFPVVVKKYNGSNGELVFVRVKDEKACIGIIKKYFKGEEYVLIEKEFYGKEFRFFATKNKVLGVIGRESASVTGDGIHTIKELIKIKNKSKKDYSRELFKIKIDDAMRLNLESQDLSLDSVIKNGKKIYLRFNSNISTGGDSIDVTDKVHPKLKHIAIKAINSIPDMPWGGVDIIINKDISEEPNKTSYAVIEVNSGPGILPHYFPIKGKPRDVVSGMLDVLFPETKR